ncbi:hypothetical protein [Paenibacillus herberti]|uniref:Uncharacterized protein n=1 Tax=Paenibacillus herberti TaxID=1619309 RepID=A0A229NYM7_9BACL|nr:hypothetical protein [Paenibacillus herberti]OXM14854.1 hypothetical protein CGZ75_18480 [Paenibacillus herberti]
MNDKSEIAAISNYKSGLGASVGVILVLFILLVIVSRTFSTDRTGSTNDPSSGINTAPNEFTKRFYFYSDTFPRSLIQTFRSGRVIVPNSAYILDPGELDYVDVVNGDYAESTAIIRYDAFPPPPGGQSIGHVDATLVNRSGIGQLSYFKIRSVSGVLGASERTYNGAPILTISYEF